MFPVSHTLRYPYMPKLLRGQHHFLPGALVSIGGGRGGRGSGGYGGGRGSNSSGGYGDSGIGGLIDGDTTCAVLGSVGGANVVKIENLRVHHDLPGVDGEIGIGEAPVKDSLGDGLIGLIVVGGKIFVGESLGGGDTLAGIENKHLLEKVQGLRIGIGELVGKGNALTLGEGLNKAKGVFTTDSLYDIIWGGTEELGDDGELMDVILAGEEGSALEHLGENTASRPDVDSNIVLLPGEHDLRGTIVTSGDVSGHLGVLDTSQAKVTDFEITVLIDENVGRLEVTMNDAGGVDILETAKNLVEEILDELLLQGPGGEKTMKVGAKELRDKVDVLQRGYEDVVKTDDILVLEVLEKFELTIGSLCEDRGGKGLHDLFDGNRLARELVLCRAYKAKSAHTNGLKIRVPGGHFKDRTKDTKFLELCHD